MYCFFCVFLLNDENIYFFDFLSDKYFGWKLRYLLLFYFLDVVGVGRDFDDIEFDNFLYNGFISNSFDLICIECFLLLKIILLKVYCINFLCWYSFLGNGVYIVYYEVIEDKFI